MRYHIADVDGCLELENIVEERRREMQSILEMNLERARDDALGLRAARGRWID
jgi:hypothetical protein